MENLHKFSFKCDLITSLLQINKQFGENNLTAEEHLQNKISYKRKSNLRKDLVQCIT